MTTYQDSNNMYRNERKLNFYCIFRFHPYFVSDSCWKYRDEIQYRSGLHFQYSISFSKPIQATQLLQSTLKCYPTLAWLVSMNIGLRKQPLHGLTCTLDYCRVAQYQSAFFLRATVTQMPPHVPPYQSVPLCTGPSR